MARFGEHGRYNGIMTINCNGVYGLSNMLEDTVACKSLLDFASEFLYTLFVEVHGRLLQQNNKVHLSTKTYVSFRVYFSARRLFLSSRLTCYHDRSCHELRTTICRTVDVQYASNTRTSEC
jgi:hypothetical protein